MLMYIAFTTGMFARANNNATYFRFFSRKIETLVLIKKIKKIKIIMIFVDKKFQTKNFAMSTGAAIYDC